MILHPSGTCTRSQLEHFNEFLGRIKHKYKHIVVIAGNHEVFFDPDWNNPALMGRRTEKLDSNVAKRFVLESLRSRGKLLLRRGYRIWDSMSNLPLDYAGSYNGI